MSWEAILSGLALLFYAVSSVHYHLHLFAGAEKSSRNAWLSALAGLSAHTGALGMWCTTHQWSILADERMPFSLVAYVLVVFQIAATTKKGWPALGSLSLPLAFIAQSYAVTPVSKNPLAGGFSSGLLRPHVLVLLLSFVAFTVAFCLAVVYLVQSKLLKTKQIKGVFLRLPPLDSVSSAAHRLAILGFTLLTLGMITGAVVAPDAWGARWYLDPHIATGIVAWVIYAAYLGASTFLGWQGRRTTYFLIAGFLVVLVAFVTSVNRPRPERPAATSHHSDSAVAVAHGRR